MNIRQSATVCGMVILLLTSFAAAQEATPTMEEVWEIVQRQQAEIEALRAELDETRRGIDVTNDKVAESEERIEATGDVIEMLAAADSGPRKTSIGGYG